MPAISILTKNPVLLSQNSKEHSSLRQRFLRGHMPVKRSINFAVIGEKPIDWKIAIPSILCIIVLAGLLSKVAVIDRFAELSAANEEVYALQRQIAERDGFYDDLADISEDYAHYTVSAMTDEERNRISRVTVMQVVEDIILPVAPLDGWMLTGNILYIHVSSNTMTEVTEMIQQLLDHPAVKSCNIALEPTTISSSANVTTQETVTAEVTVEFKRATDLQRESAKAKTDAAAQEGADAS